MRDGTPFLRVAADRIGAPGSPAKMPFRATNAANWSSIIRIGAKMAVIRRRIARRAVSSHTQRAGRVPYGESRLNDYAAQELEWALSFLGIAPGDLLGRPFSTLDSIVRIEREVLTKPYLLPRNLDMEIIGVRRPAAALALIDPRGTYLGLLLSWPVRSSGTAPAR